METSNIIIKPIVQPRILPSKGFNTMVINNICSIFLFLLSEEPTLCLLCLQTERQVACLPCGHLTSCVACGHSLKTCPICRAAVKAFVRIYT